MAGLNETAKNAALDHLGTLITHISVHDDDPGPSGDNELSVSREAISWNTAAGGNLDSIGNQDFTISGGDTVHSVGLWSASNGGTFYGSKALPVPETFANGGTFSVTDFDINIDDPS